MKAEELRIGNWVKDRGGKLLRVDRIFGDKIECDVRPSENTDTGIPIHFHPLTEDIGFAEPLPITEEVLLKCGFEVRESSSCKEFHIGTNNVTHDWLFSVTWLIRPDLINAPDVPFYRNGRHEIHYLHQLQNLYYALTGTELTYTP